MASIEITGDVKPVPIDDLLQNNGLQYLNQHKAAKGFWCLRLNAHDPMTCTYLHRKEEKAKDYIFIKGEPAPVPISHLVQNPGLTKIKDDNNAAGQNSNVVSGSWCNIASPHDCNQCKNLHLGNVPQDIKINIDGELAPVPLPHLLYNKGAANLVSFPNRKGVWCNNKIIHDKLQCTYIHRRVDDHPECVNVENEKFPVAVSQLMRNQAVDYLLANPHCSGRWCGRSANHDPKTCSYLHRKINMVRVEGKQIRVNTLASNRGLRYLLEHPESNGRWCTSTEHDHPVGSCIFIHSTQNNNHGGNNNANNNITYNNNSNGVGNKGQQQYQGRGNNYQQGNQSLQQHQGQQQHNQQQLQGQQNQQQNQHGNRQMQQQSNHQHGGNRSQNSGNENQGRNNNSSNVEKITINNSNNTGESNTSTRVNVQGTMINTSELVQNRAITYLTSHAEATGVLCTNKKQHDYNNCRYVHRLNEN